MATLRTVDDHAGHNGSVSHGLRRRIAGAGAAALCPIVCAHRCGEILRSVFGIVVGIIRAQRLNAFAQPNEF